VTSSLPSALRRHAFLAGLAPQDVELLAAAAAEVRFPAGHRLFEEGGPAERFWVIREGRVALDIRLPGQERLIVQTLGEGDIIGLSWLEAPREWQFGAEIIQPTAAFELDAAAVRALCEGRPQLGYQLVRRLMAVTTSRLQATRIRLLDLYGGGAPLGAA
jgi:CRP-like cAMP-binding protein